MANGIDPALVRLSRLHPRALFIPKGSPGIAVQLASTCTDGQPACWPIFTETATTQLLYAAMRSDYAALADSTYCHKEKVGHIAELYGRKDGTIRKILSTFHRSS